MNHCLFVQWKKPTDASRYVIDGETSEYSGTEQQDKIMKLLADVPKYNEICSRDKDNLSPSFRFSSSRIKSCIFHFIEGNFEETDSAGRKLVYIFMTSESDPQKIVGILKEYSSLLEVTPHHEDLEVIKNYKLKTKKNVINNIKSLVWTIIATIVLLLLYILLNLRSKL